MSEEAGIYAYDLEPPLPKPPGLPVAYTPMCDLGKRQPARNLLVPPPLPDDHVRVKLDDDYYAGPGWSEWHEQAAEWPSAIHDIPAEQCDRWVQAQRAYTAMQDEIAGLLNSRIGGIPGGWTPKPGYQVQP